MTSYREMIVETGGLRLDLFLAEASGLTRSQVRRLLDEGHVTVNASPPSKAGMRLDVGDAVCFREPAPEPAQTLAQDIPLDILFEDADILVLSKPAGLVVHPAAGNHDGTLVNALLHHCHDLPGIGGVIRPGIVHRLDKDTSGLMVVAKTESALTALQAQFKAHTVRKVYQALVYGVPAPHQGDIEGAISRHHRDRKRFTVDTAGKPARTHYRTLGTYGAFSHLEIILETGRTHQIRVHLTYIGHPIVGDPVYTPARRAAHIKDLSLRREIEKVKRQMLHAGELAFDHPARGERMDFSVPLPEDMAGLLNRLKGNATL